MAATLKLTAATTAELDLSSYLNVQEDGGLDPADGGFLQPAFTDSTIGAGAALVNVDTVNKELQWPLQLKGATKDAMHALVQTIRRKLDEPGVRIEWKDDSASLSTFYDVEYGRLEPAYRYFRARQKWLTATLHAWVRPYGHTATERLVATAQASGYGAPVMLVASLGGDVEALGQYTVSIASYGQLGDYAAVVAAVLPSPSYPFRIPAASMALAAGAGASLVGASGAAGSQFIGKIPVATGSFSLGDFTLPFPGAMGGRHRILALIRSGSGGTAGIYVGGPQQTIGSVALTATNWTLADFGVWNVPSHVATEAARFLSFVAASTASSALIGSYRTAINEAYLIPEEQAGMLRVVERSSTFGPPKYVLDAINGQMIQRTVASSTLAYDVQDSLRGQLPAIPPAATVAVGVLVAAVSQQTGSTFGAGVPGSQSVNVELRVRERFTFQR